MTTGQGPAVQAPPNREEIEGFLYHEARLIDEGQLDDWLALFTSDACYWVPSNRDNINPSREASLIYDNWQRLEERVWRLQSGLAHTTDPGSRTRHLITNVELAGFAQNELTVSSNLALFHLRRGVQRLYASRCEHRLRWVDGSWRIAFKKVELLNNNEPIATLQFIL